MSKGLGFGNRCRGVGALSAGRTAVVPVPEQLADAVHDGVAVGDAGQHHPLLLDEGFHPLRIHGAPLVELLAEGVELLNAIQDVFLDDKITIA